jgi:hypothetical protein
MYARRCNRAWGTSQGFTRRLCDAPSCSSFQRSAPARRQVRVCRNSRLFVWRPACAHLLKRDLGVSQCRTNHCFRRRKSRRKWSSGNASASRSLRLGRSRTSRRVARFRCSEKACRGDDARPTCRSVGQYLNASRSLHSGRIGFPTGTPSRRGRECEAVVRFGRLLVT